MIKDILVDFVLFSFIESWIYALFFNKLCNIKKFSFWQILIMGLGISIIGILLPPIIYQICIILWMALCICCWNECFDFMKKIRISFFAMIYTLVIEMSIFSFYGSIGIKSFVENSTFDLFLLLVPIRIFEIFIIFGGEFIMKSWAGNIKRK